MKPVKTFLVTAFTFFCFQNMSAQDNRIVANPMNLNYRFQFGKPGYREAADPVCEYFNGKYYLFASKSGGYWSSPDLAKWTYIPATTIGTIENYAPTILVLDDAMYFMASGKPVRIYKNTNPDKDTWTLANTQFDFPLIGDTDPAFFRDDDGRVYLYWGCSDKNPIIGVEVNPKDGFKVIGEPAVLIEHHSDQYGWEVSGNNNEENKDGWNEGPSMNKHNGKYYLQYAAPGTQFRVYGDGVYVGDHPLGPFRYAECNPFSFKPGGFIGGAGHGHTFKDKYGNYWHVSTMKISVRHMFERRIALFPLHIDDDGNFIQQSVWSDYPFVIPDKRTDFKNASVSAGWNLLTYQRPVTVSSFLPDGIPSYAVDEKVETWWSAETGKSGEWFQVDMREKVEVMAIQVNFADHDFDVSAPHDLTVYRYIIEASDDGVNWEIITDKSENSDDAVHDLIVLNQPVEARYLRITNSDELPGKFSLYGFRAFGKGKGALPNQVTDLKVTRNAHDPRKYDMTWSHRNDADGYIVNVFLENGAYVASVMVFDHSYQGGFFNRESNYVFTVDAFNANGVTKGTEKSAGKSQGVLFSKDFSPAEGLIIRQEQPYREEICLNGYWDLQIVDVPADWKSGTGIAPELPKPQPDQWESVKIKIPSPVNVNNWGAGQNVGEGTDSPYAPSSVYYPSYPKKWGDARMVWLKKTVTVPSDWNSKNIILHFEAVAGECVVLVNGKEVARNFDAWLPFDVDITDYIGKDAPCEILTGLRHTRLFDKKHPDYRYFGATYPSGSNTDDLIGIWQDVFLYAVPEIHITDVFVKPWLNKNELEIEAQVVNLSAKKTKIRLEGDIKEWLNKISFNDPDRAEASEINWTLGNTAMSVSSQEIEIKPGETKTVVIKTPVNNRLKKWSPDSPNLYTLLLQVKNGKTNLDIKATRFGWRQFTVEGKDFHLNGEKIQCFGDIQHPFGAYICSRRFAFAWYQMIKDFGGNAVRPHAQPWPRVYYDLADEMGLMVLDETALFGSSIRLNLEEEITWERSHEHLKRLILRDRNHPSVIGWSAGNEMFAIALLNKPPKEVSEKWDERLVELTLSAKQFDTTRDFITLDGDRDMDGHFPIWSKHFAHGLKLDDLPQNPDKPLIVGECGATYYGRPSQLYPFSGEKAFESYYGRNEALAVDIYQNAALMARPRLAYFSPSEVCWFGIEHLNLGYHDFSKLPNLKDGIFPMKPYQEGKPGYQFERIPPYVTTFNPGLDPDLPLYKPLPMFEALRAALSQPQPKPCAWDSYTEILPPALPALPEPIYQIAFFAGDSNGKLAGFIREKGIQTVSNTKTPNLLIIDAETVSQQQLNSVVPVADRIKKNGGLILVMSSGEQINPVAGNFLPAPVNLTERRATALENNPQSAWGKFFHLPNLYFAEQEGDRHILKRVLSGELVEKGTVVFQASRTDWSLFNNVAENRKCAQTVLYEHLKKAEGAALLTYRFGNATLAVSVLDYRLNTKETADFWKTLFAAMKINISESTEKQKETIQKPHDLLMDGPVDE